MEEILRLFKMFFKQLFNQAGAEYSRCKNCKSFKIGVSYKIKKNMIFRKMYCINCGRRFWSKEIMYDKKPYWDVWSKK